MHFGQKTSKDTADAVETEILVNQLKLLPVQIQIERMVNRHYTLDKQSEGGGDLLEARAPANVGVNQLENINKT